jgi:D-alanyl-D-alanine carboxypeptidase
VVDANRSPAGETFEYSNTNYVLLGLIIEQLRGSPVADVLRDGVLSGDGLERLIFQPDEKPTEPMAMTNGESGAALKKGGGYLPFLSSASAGSSSGGMASDSPSLARWWQALCAGEIVSADLLAEMATFHDGYGLGLYAPYPGVVGHTGEDVGFVAWAGCLPENGSVIVVLHNRVVDDIGAMPLSLVEAVLSD